METGWGWNCSPEHSLGACCAALQGRSGRAPSSLKRGPGGRQTWQHGRGGKQAPPPFSYLRAPLRKGLHLPAGSSGSPRKNFHRGEVGGQSLKTADLEEELFTQVANVKVNPLREGEGAGLQVDPRGHFLLADVEQVAQTRPFCLSYLRGSPSLKNRCQGPTRVFGEPNQRVIWVQVLSTPSTILGPAGPASALSSPVLLLRVQILSKP